MACPNRQELSDYNVGKLPESSAATLVRHLESCPSCQAALAEVSGKEETSLEESKKNRRAPGGEASAIGRKASTAPRGDAASTADAQAAAASQSRLGSAGAASPSRIGSAAIGIEALAQAVVDLGLATASELTSVIGQLPADKQNDATALARALVELQKLTKFQAQNLLLGKARGLRFGDYVVLDGIGSGGMGHVYRARHRRMDRVVALKVLAGGGWKNAESVSRFQREVRAAAKLLHPNIVTAFDAGDQDGVHYLVMEFVDGPDLASLVKKQGRQAPAVALDYVQQAARGLAFAHGKGIVHRDIKPGNLLVDREGVVKILDMGLARLNDDSEEANAQARAERTQSGQVMGTLDYMAPEQALNTSGADAKSDVYSLGCTFYRMLSGENLYGGTTVAEKILAHREQPIPSVRRLRPEIAPAVDALISRMVAKRPADRPTMNEVMDAIEAIKRGAAPVVATNFDPSLPPVAAPVAAAPLYSIGPTAVVAPASGSVASPSSFGVPVAAAASFGVPSAAPLVQPASVRLPPRRSNGVAFALAAAAAGAVALGVWVYVRNDHGETVAQVQVPAGGSVQIVSSPTGTGPGAKLTSASATPSGSPPATPSTAPVASPTATAVVVVAAVPGASSTAVPNGPSPTAPTPSRAAPPAVTASNFGAASATSGLPPLCDLLAAKRSPVGLRAEAVAFAGPRGDGRDGANGFVVASPPNWEQRGTAWEFDYVWSGSARGVQVVHPIGGGHARIVILPEQIGLYFGGLFDADVYSVRGAASTTLVSQSAALLMPLRPDVPYRIRSIVFSSGLVTLSINGIVLKATKASVFRPQTMKPPFDDPNCPPALDVGQGAILIGPRDGGRNEASNVRFSIPPAPPTSGPGFVARTPSTTISVAGGPSASAAPVPAAAPSATGAPTGAEAPFMPVPFTIGGSAPGRTTIVQGLGTSGPAAPSPTGLAGVAIFSSFEFTRSKPEERFPDRQAPDYLAPAAALQYVATRGKADGRTGMAEFRVTRPGKLYMAVSFETDGRLEPNELAEKYDDAKLRAEGWNVVEKKTLRLDVLPPGTSSAEAVHTIYERVCAQGDLFRIRTRKYAPPVLFVAPDDLPTTNPLAAGPARTTDTSLIVGALQTGATPADVVAGALTFRGPKGDRGDGANGLAVDVPHDYKALGSQWRLNYTVQGDAEGVHLVHPHGAGHLRVQLSKSRVDLFINGAWGVGSKIYTSGSNYPKSSNTAAVKLFPISERVPHVVVSKLDAAGNYELSLDGIWIARAKIAAAKPLRMIPPFADTAAPPTLNAGQAALLVGSSFDQTNHVGNARLEPAGGSAGAASSNVVVAGGGRNSPAAPTAGAAVAPPEIARRIVAFGGSVTTVDSKGIETNVRDATMLTTDVADVVEIRLLNPSSIGDADLAVIGTLKNLRRLTIQQAQITGIGFVHLKDLTRLSFADFGRNPVDDDGLEHLAALPSLTTLSFYRTQVGDRGVEKLRGNTQLQSLNLSFTPVTDECMSSIATLRSLRSLILDSTAIGDVGIEALGNLPELSTLIVSVTRVGDRSVPRLAQMTQLRSLTLRNALVSPAGVQHLRTQLPNTQVNY